MSAIDLYLALKKIPEVTDDEAKQAAAAAAAAAEQTDRLQRIEDRLHRIETKLAEFQITSRIILGLLLTILAILLVSLFQ